MGNSMTDYYDEQDYQAELRNIECRKKNIARITALINRIDIEKHDQTDYENLMFLFENREKILRNEKLIEILG